MKYLKRLSVLASSDDEILDLQHTSSSSPPQYLQRLYLGGRLEKLPDRIPKLKSLVRLSLSGSGLTKNDPLKALQVLPSLVRLWLLDAYDGEELYFEVGRFQKLKQLTLVGLNGLNSVIIEEGALPLLEELMIGPSPQLKEVPSGIHHLTNLKTLEEFVDMLDELINRMEPEPNPNPIEEKTTGSSSISYPSCQPSGPESEKKCLLLKSALFQQYFNRKVENARVGEDKNELNVNSINFQVFCCQRLSWKEIQLQRQPQTNKECHLCQHGHVYYV